MPDRRRHRGPHPKDETLFAPDAHGLLRRAVEDLAWLLERGYASNAALKLVGDRFQLRDRQRLAVMRATCTDSQRASRASSRIEPAALQGEAVAIDGYNVLITLEAALAGGVLLLCRDGTLRDLASFHGHFKRVEETDPAIELLGRWLDRHAPSHVTLFLDRPVSNSGRLAERLREHAAARACPWTVELVNSPDHELRTGAAIVASADSAVIDGAARWVNLARHVVGELEPVSPWIDLRPPM